MLRGRPLLSYALEAAWAVPVLDPLVVVLGAHAEAIRSSVDLSGLEVVECADWASGQAASLRAGVAAAGDVDAAVVLLGDMPFVTGQVIAAAVDQLTGELDAVRCDLRRRARASGRARPGVLAAVPRAGGDVGARELMRSFRVCEWDAAAYGDPTDIDTPQQLDAVRRLPPVQALGRPGTVLKSASGGVWTRLAPPSVGPRATSTRAATGRPQITPSRPPAT